MANNKVVFGDTTVMDITDSTVTPETLKQGEIAYNSAGQRIVGTLVTIGHKILDAFGNLMTNRENLQFQGTYVSDDATNNKTVVPIVRSMQQAEFEQLTAAEKTGMIDVTDAGFVPTDDERLLDLKDCSIVLPVNGQVLKYNSATGKWVNDDEVSIPEIVDNLTTDDATKTLSAKQGKVLNEKIPAVINDVTTGGTTNALSAEQGKNLNSYIGTKFSKSGDTLTGDLTLKTSTDDSPDIVFSYGNGSEKSRIWTQNVYTATAGPNYRVYNASGTALYSGTLQVVSSSSERFKQNIKDMTEERARKILEIRPVTFDWKRREWSVTRQNDNAGVIAEEVSQIIPDLVVYEGTEEGEFIESRVEYDRFAPYLIKMVQMQQKEIDELKKLVGGN